jgi:diadenosine tetraphosphate (Ap4A) HIT family hydrolase
MGVNHAHIKLYPLHGLDKKFTEMWAKEKVYFADYPGFITTQLGPEKSTQELEKTAEKIRSAV